MDSELTRLHQAIIHGYKKPLGRRERRRVEIRDRILRAALRLYSERGVNDTTVEDITNEADVGKGTFFNYFPSKDDVLPHLCKLKMGKIREVVSRSLNSRDSMDKVLYELSIVLIEEFEPSPALMHSILAVFFSNASARQQMVETLEEDREILAELMAARQARGELRKDLSPQELALQFQRSLFGATVLWSFDPSNPLQDSLKQMTQILWSGIRERHIAPDAGDE